MCVEGRGGGAEGHFYGRGHEAGEEHGGLGCISGLPCKQVGVIVCVCACVRLWVGVRVCVCAGRGTSLWVVREGYLWRGHEAGRSAGGA